MYVCVKEGSTYVYTWQHTFFWPRKTPYGVFFIIQKGYRRGKTANKRSLTVHPRNPPGVAIYPGETYPGLTLFPPAPRKAKVAILALFSRRFARSENILGKHKTCKIYAWPLTLNESKIMPFCFDPHIGLHMDVFHICHDAWTSYYQQLLLVPFDINYLLQRQSYKLIHGSWYLI
jgi:hypothetical protein